MSTLALYGVVKHGNDVCIVKIDESHLLICYASARAAARGNILANQEELRGSELMGLRQESTSEIVSEDIVLIRRRSPIHVWQSWSVRVRQRYNAALQQWPIVRELTCDEILCNIQETGKFSLLA